MNDNLAIIFLLKQHAADTRSASRREGTGGGFICADADPV